MPALRTLVVYYSLEGNTAYAAERIAKAGGFDLLPLAPVTPYPSKGFRKFFVGGRDAVFRRTPALAPYEFDPSAYDRIVFGFPVWASSVAPPIRTFIRDNPLAGKRFAAFACQGGSGADKAFIQLRDALGVDALDAQRALIAPKAHPSPETEREIDAFVEELLEE